MVGRGEGKLVTECNLAALGLRVLLTPIPWCRWSGVGKGTNSTKLLGSGGL